MVKIGVSRLPFMDAVESHSRTYSRIVTYPACRNCRSETRCLRIAVSDNGNKEYVLISHMLVERNAIQW